MTPAGHLDALRTLVLVIAPDGTIDEARGGFGGFLGVDVAALPGTSVFDHVVPTDVDQVATYFLESMHENDDVIAVPMPFRVGIVAPDGVTHEVDVIPSGIRGPDGVMRFVTEIVPVALFGSTTRSLDLEMAGAPRSEVCRMLCEELVVDNVNYTTRWVLIDLTVDGSPVVHTAREADVSLVTAVSRDLDRGWTPWETVEPRSTTAIPMESVGVATQGEIEARGWHRVLIAPVHVRQRLVGAFLLMGTVPTDYRADLVKANVAARIQNLVKTTSLLFDRWETHDQLAAAASTDELTGLMNRRAFFEELERERRTGAVIYVDVDQFKAVNDGYGHEMGDRVLTAIGRRIVASCREWDLVARIGGDEFVVLIRNADHEIATELSDRIAADVRRPLGIEDGPASVSVSVGFALLDGVDPERALDAADAEMLAAKRARRAINQHRWANVPFGGVCSPPS